MKVVEEPPIQFRCTSCKALNEGKVGEFRAIGGTPPQWEAICGFCRCVNLVSPTPLIARHVGHGDLGTMLRNHPLYGRRTW